MSDEGIELVAILKTTPSGLLLIAKDSLGVRAPGETRECLQGDSNKKKKKKSNTVSCET